MEVYKKPPQKHLIEPLFNATTTVYDRKLGGL